MLTKDAHNDLRPLIYKLLPPYVRTDRPVGLVYMPITYAGVEHGAWGLDHESRKPTNLLSMTTSTDNTQHCYETVKTDCEKPSFWLLKIFKKNSKAPDLGCSVFLYIFL